MSKEKPLQEVWDYVEGNSTLGDLSSVRQGTLKDKDRPSGDCWACKKFAEEAFTHESPGTAKCCIGCDAYEGDI